MDVNLNCFLIDLNDNTLFGFYVYKLLTDWLFILATKGKLKG